MKLKLKLICIIFLIFLVPLTLISCKNAEKAESDVLKKSSNINYDSVVLTFEHPQTKQPFKIVNAYKLYDNYFNKVDEEQDTSYLDIYKKEVIEPMYSDCFENGEYLHMVEPILNGDPQHLNLAPSNLAGVQSIIEQIDVEQMNNLIEESLIKSSDLLPTEKETTVCVIPSSNKNMKMVTVGAGKILVLYNWDYTEETIRAGVAHEYHHSVWTEKHLAENNSFTVLDNLIFEGKAVMFEKIVYPDLNLTPVDLTYDKDYWSKIEPDLEKYDFNRSIEILMGGYELPWLYGYSEGYKMVKSYLDMYPEATPVEWMGLSSEDIFIKGKYLEHYK